MHDEKTWEIHDDLLGVKRKSTGFEDLRIEDLRLDRGFRGDGLNNIRVDGGVGFLLRGCVRLC